MLSLAASQRRLQRYLSAMERAEIDAAVLSGYRNIYYLTGNLREVEWPQVLVIGPSGKLTSSRTLCARASAAIRMKRCRSIGL